MEEQWKAVVGWEGIYEVSSLGNIRRIKRGKGARRLGKPLKPWPTLGGYSMIYLCKRQQKYPRLLHRLIAEAFIGQSSLEVNHKNGIKSDNRVSNLEYMTRRQNADDAMARGCYSRGTKCHSAKLTPAKVRTIRLKLKRGLSEKYIAGQYQVSQSLINAIRKRKVWSWVL